MAIIDPVSKKNLGREFARELFATKSANLGSDVIEAALDAADDFLSASFFTSFNSALPVAFRTNTNVKEKAMLLTIAIRRKVADL